MSFFGFDPTGPPKGSRAHPKNAPGFSEPHNAFAGLSGAARDDDADDGIDFEETYDGLGDELDELGDDLNAVTFGGMEDDRPDFDFSGETAKVADAIMREGKKTKGSKPQYQQHQQHHQQHHQPQQHYHQPQHHNQQQQQQYKPKFEPKSVDIPDLKPEMSIWASPDKSQSSKPMSSLAQAHYRHLEDIERNLTQGGQAAPATAPQQQRSAPSPAVSSSAPTTRKFMSLEEVEAQILNQKKPQNGQQPPDAAIISAVPRGAPNEMYGTPPAHLQHHGQQMPGFNQQRGMPHDMPMHHPNQQFFHMQQHQQIPPNMEDIARQPPHGMHPDMPTMGQPPMPLPPHMNQNFPQAMPNFPNHAPPPVLSDEEKNKLLEEESKRLKRNHKIAQLARYNGLMTPADKNFITRIQLQQLMSVNENSFVEDFYYQVHMAIRSRSTPQQPMNQFAQTYLFQNGQDSRGGKGRRHDGHLQRMEQQVQRAVAAAKARPKASQLVLEGSLGKISFSNVKTPKPLLNIKRPDSAGGIDHKRTQKSDNAGLDRKTILRSLETVYDCLLDLEMHERSQPLPGVTPPEEAAQWESVREGYISKLWKALKIMDPIDPTSSFPHPFIAILSYAKGKKAIPRVFRHINNEQRITILTMIVVHLDGLDVVRHGHYSSLESTMPQSVLEEIDLFSQTVLPPLLGYLAEAPMHIVIGLLGILIERVDVVFISQSRIGLTFLTMFTSRAEIIKQAGQADESELFKWGQSYDKLFKVLEDNVLDIFPPREVVGDDMYVWQFLASMAVGASMEQQQKLVGAVKDRVMENVVASKTQPGELATQRAANTNLFMRAIGLDIDLLMG